MPSPLTYLGPAISGAGSNLSQFGDQQEQLRERLQQMIQMRLDKANEENRQNEELALQQNQDKRAQAEADKKASDEKDQSDFQKEVAAGKPIPAIPSLPMLGPASALQPQGSSTAEVPASSVPYTKDELIQKALEKGVLPVDKFLEYTKTNQPTGDLGEYAQWLKEGNQGGISQFLKTKAQATHIDVTGAADVRAKQQEVNGARGTNQAQTKDYDIAKRAALAFDQDYKRYEAIKASGNQQAIKVAQQGMLDKYITSSTGKSTGDAQFNNFRDSQGLTNQIQNLYSRVTVGGMAPDEAFQEMRKITMGTAEALRQKTKQANEATKDYIGAAIPRVGYIDPAEAIVHPDKMLSQDSASFAIPSDSPIKVSTKAERDALPPGTVYIGPDGNTATR